MKLTQKLAALLFAALITLPAAAQEKQDMFRPETSSVTSQSIAPDARAGGMGDIGAATDPDVVSQYWNPAKYPFTISRAGVSLNYTPWLRRLVSDTGTYTVPWDLTIDGGSRLQTGVYLYRVHLTSEGATRISKAKKLIVVGNN